MICIKYSHKASHLLPIQNAKPWSESKGDYNKGLYFANTKCTVPIMYSTCLLSYTVEVSKRRMHLHLHRVGSRAASLAGTTQPEAAPSRACGLRRSAASAVGRRARPWRVDCGLGERMAGAALTSGQRPRADGRLGGQRPWRFNCGLCERRPWRADGRQPRMSRWMTEPPSHVRWSTMDGRQRHETFASMRQCGFLAHLSLPRQNTSPVGLVCWSCFSYAQWSGVRQICFCIPKSV
jgi:hypothetical protein